MKKSITLAAVAAVAGLAAPAMAQDSVSQLPGTFVGDALAPWDAASQSTNFVVDLTPFTTSGGAQFGIAPLIKSSKTSAEFFSSLVSAQTISATEVSPKSFGGDYLFWDAPGGGVNTGVVRGMSPNSGGQLITPEASGEIRQFTTMFGEFATTDAGTSYNGAIGATVQYDLANPTRLYVSRVIAGMTGADNTQNNGSIGVGTADASGFVYFRADNSGSTGPSPLVNQNIYRVDLTGRAAGTLNVLSGAGASDAAASDHVVAAFAGQDAHSTPGNIPMDVAGRPVYVGATFSVMHAYESSPGMVSYTGSHLLTANQRGTIATYKADLTGSGGVATGAVLGYGAAGETQTLNLYGMDANGAVVPGSPVLLTRPAGPILDRFDNFMVGGAIGTAGEFDHYHSQTAFAGGNSPVALGRDGQGRTLAAGVSYLTGGNQDPFNAILVARFDPADPGATTEWGIGGFVDIGSGPNGISGKPVYDDMGNALGQLRTYNELDPDFNNGPSISGVSFDGAGNIWFVAPVSFDDGKGGTFINSTLIRGVYQPDVNGGFGFRLEKVVSFFDTFASQNTGLNYRVFGFEIVDSNSVNSGTFWSSNVKQGTWGDIDPADLDPADPRSTAGVVVSTSITYDVDNDGDYNLSTVTDPTTIDEAYNVLLYIAPTVAVVGNDCPADLDGSGSVGSGDLAILLAAWGGGGASDLDGSGTVGSGDLAILLAAWGACP